MREFGLDTQKCTGITVDGAPVMTGSEGRVRLLLQNIVPLCLLVYCPAHGFNLVLKDVVETVDPRFKVVFEFIQTVAKKPKFSGKARVAFDELSELADLVDNGNGPKGDIMEFYPTQSDFSMVKGLEEFDN